MPPHHWKLFLPQKEYSPKVPNEQTPNIKAPTMPLPTTIPAAIIETILTRLAVLFLTGAAGDMTAARDAASQMLAAYHPETLEELTLAASIIGFSFQALEALSQAADPDKSLTRIIRLRGSAVTLSRESTKAATQLAQFQKSRQQPSPAQPETQPEPAQPAPKAEPAVIAVAVPKTKSEEDRQRDLRIAASIKRAEARFGTQPSAPVPANIPDHRPAAHAL
jgi:hypothetical protein